MKNKYVKMCLALFGVTLGLGAFAQEDLRCGSDQKRRELIEQHPEILAEEERLEKSIQKWIADFKQKADTVTIDLNNYDTIRVAIVFHVIHNGGIENISDAQIIDAVAMLNEQMNGVGNGIGNVVPEYEGLIGRLKFKFELATIDPQGRCTNGIDRINSLETFNGTIGAKLNPWDRRKYLNVWVVADMDPGVAGFAYFPSSVAGTFNQIDGINIRHEYVGRIGTGAQGRGGALVHEVGHWLNLAHVWGLNNDAGVTCGDDFVDDTPITKGSSGCPTSKAECDLDPIDIITFKNYTTANGTSYQDANWVNRGINYNPVSATGLSSTSTVNGSLAFNQWPTGANNGDTSATQLSGAINTGKYYEFSMSNKTRNRINLRNLYLSINRNQEGPRTFAVRSSVDNFSSNIRVFAGGNQLDSIAGNVYFFKKDSAQAVKNVRFQLTGQSYSSINGPITFRIYSWNAESANGVFALDSISIDGESGLIENVQNHMDYSACGVMFTKGQILRMLAVLNDTTAASSYRNILFQSFTNQQTGINGNQVFCSPNADFYASRPVACANGAAVTFRDNSGRAFVKTRKWTIQDATYLSGTNDESASPIVRFTSPGWKTVSLTVSNDQGSTTKTVEKFINVSDETVALPVPHIQSFEGGNELGESWIVQNVENNATRYSNSTVTSFFGQKSVRLNAFESVNGLSLRDGNGDIDYLYSPAFNLSGKEGWVITFKLASATRSTVLANVTQSLAFDYSTNCGTSWVTERTISGSALNTAGYYATSYTAQRANPNDWREIVIPVTPGMARDNVRFRFAYTSASASNNLYMDDFNISQSSGLDEKATDASAFNIFPNPINNNSVLNFYLGKDSNVSLVLTDITGKAIAAQDLGNLSNGEQNVSINNLTQNLSAGVYMLNINLGNSKVTKKIVVQ
ncbi:MAG TPA: M43 family zinc metalloprotease [Luteibaculaceae bacterium]|nr:M43 family zinc metalloprotease [Luteibaculaceae bacterium]